MSADHPREQRMRELLTEHASRNLDSSPDLNADTVIARARRRRRPRQLAAGGASALVVVAALTITIPAINGGLVGGDSPMSASSLAEADMAERAPEPEATTLRSTPVDGAELCGTAPVEHPQFLGLDVELKAHAAVVDESQLRVDAEVVLANTGSSPIYGLDAARFTLEQHGLAVAYFDWDASPTAAPEPGEATSHSVTFIPTPCYPEQELTGDLRLIVTVTLQGESVSSNLVVISSP